MNSSLKLTKTAQKKMSEKRLRLISGFASSNSESLHFECIDCGEERRMSLKSLLYKPAKQCRYCSGKRAIWDKEKAKRDLIAAGAFPVDEFPGAYRRWKSKCLMCERIVYPTLFNVVRYESNPCRFCASKIKGQIRRERISVSAKALMVEAGLIPLTEFPGVARPWKCKCEGCGKFTSPQFRHVRNGHRCIHCTNKSRGERLRVVKADFAREEMVKAGLNPLERYPGVNRKWKCQCVSCKVILGVRFSGFYRDELGCKPCSAKRIGGQKKLAKAKQAEKLMSRVGLVPIVPYPGANEIWRCRCQRCGKVVSPKFTSVQQGSGGCRFCSASGFHFDRPGILYLIKSNEFFALKIGITGEESGLLRKNRIAQHDEFGWELIAQWRFKLGYDAESLEAEVLAWWRGKLGAPAALAKSDMPQGGWTETASLLFVDVDDTIRFVDSRIQKTAK